MLKAFRKFIPLWKVEEQKDGTLFVYGLVTAQKPDQENEVCDYESTKPFYQKLVARYAKITSIDGMEMSIAPLREMHQLVAVGCGKSIDFDDAALTICMRFHVVAAETCKKVKAGVLPGFSQGGDYVKTWQKNGSTWYTADPGEVSLVDSPCLEDALIQSLVEKSFTFVQENGSTELRKFHITPDPKAADRLAERDGLLAKIAELTKQVEATKMKPELLAILTKLAKAGTETVTLSKEEMLELAKLGDVSKASAAILDHLKSMHKAVSDHTSEMHDHVNKCYKALGHDGMKVADTGDVKKTFTKEELDAQVAAALEKAKKDAEKPATFSKEDVEKLIAESLEKAKKDFVPANDPTNRVKLTLVGRDGKPIEKSATDTPGDGESMSKSVGF